MNKADSSLLLTLGVIAVLGLGLALGALRPLWAKYEKLKDEQGQTSQELKKLDERAATLSKMAKNMAEIESLSEKALIYLPTSIEAGSFLMDTAAMAGQSGANISHISFQPTAGPKKGASPLAEYPVALTAEGSFEQLKTLLRFLEENLRFSLFTSATFSQQKDFLSLQLTGAIFSKTEDPQPADRTLVIEEGLKKLLTERQPFGAPIKTDGPSRADPFAEL